MAEEQNCKLKSVTIEVSGPPGFPLEKMTLHWRPQEFPFPTIDLDTHCLTTRQIKALGAISDACCEFLEHFTFHLQDFSSTISLIEIEK